MIPEEYKQDLIDAGIFFITRISEAYGAEEGIKLWEQIATVLDPDVKGEIFMAMLTGEYSYGRITVHCANPNANKVAIIKAFRNVDKRNLGLKEAKDLADQLHLRPIVIEVHPRQRTSAIKELQSVGCQV
jgi:ribosomal protein L7/L12